MAAAIKMDELLVSWLGSDTVYENVLSLIETYRAAEAAKQQGDEPPNSPTVSNKEKEEVIAPDASSGSSPRGVIPPFYPVGVGRRRSKLQQHDTWEPLDEAEEEVKNTNSDVEGETSPACVRIQVHAIYQELGEDPPITSPGSAASENDKETTDDDTAASRKYLTLENFVRITKEVCRFPSFFNGPLYKRILQLWNSSHENVAEMDVVTRDMFQWFWLTEMEPHDAPERFFRLLKQPELDYIGRDDFLPYIKELLNDHPVSL